VSRALRLAIVLRGLRRYARSPYLFLWRTLELQAALAIAQAHGLDLRRAIDLDFGCGDGIVGATVARRIGLGVDRDARALRWARRERAYASLVEATGACLPLASGSQRLVFSNSVLEHIPDDGTVLTELARVIAPGGHLVLTVVADGLPNLALGPQASVDERRAFDMSLGHHHYYTASSLGERLQRCGLEVLASRSYLSARALRGWYRLREWEAGHPRAGLGLRAYQLLRIPVSLALLPRVATGAGEPIAGGGLVVVARKRASATRGRL
jgi:SAM-dependent methyltransferase